MSPLKRITLVLCASGLLTVVLPVSFLASTLRESATQNWVESRSNSARQLAEMLDSELAEAQGRLEFLASLPAFQAPPDPSLIQPELNGIPAEADPARRTALDWLIGQREHAFDAVFVLLPDGDHYLSHPYAVQQSLEPYNLSHRTYFQAASKTKHSVLSDAFIGADDVPAVVIDVPVISPNGQLTSHIGGLFYLSALSRLIQEASLRGPPGSVFLLDRSGVPIAYAGNQAEMVEALLAASSEQGLPPLLQAGKNPEVQSATIATDAGDLLVISARLPSGWTLGLVSDRDAVVAQFSPGVWRVASFAAVLLVLLVGIGISLARQIGLRWQAAELQLQHSHDRLEARVEARTGELKTEIASLERTRAALRDSQELFRAITNQSCEGITVADIHGRYTLVNPTFCEMIGYSEEELLEMTVFDVKAKDQDHSSFARSKASLEGLPFQVHLQRKNGETFFSEITGRKIKVGDADAVLGTVRDITARIQSQEEKLLLERQLLHAQKLESLGVLAGGIAHDFNNLLMAVLGNAELALAALPVDSPARGGLHEIQSTTHRAAELARQMLAYSGRGSFVIEPVDLGALVSETAQLLDVAISKKVALEIRLAKDLPQFDGDVTQIRQIIMNLITNASESMREESGIVTLTTGIERHLAEGPNGTPGFGEMLAGGTYAYLEVQDNGCGMDAETRARIFDPFFTTKFAGRGLGMSAVQGIVRGHKGAIRILSESDRGTTIRILFPVEGVVAGVPRPLPDPAPDRERGRTTFHGTVLVADDEQAIRSVAKKMLELMGFEVLTARDGREALDIFRQHADGIALVLLDLTMPHLDGVQVFAELHRLRPNVPVILCSGYSEVDATDRFASTALAGFLQKPFDMDALAEALHLAKPLVC